MIFKKAETFAKIYKESLYELMKNPEFISKPRNLEIKEILDFCIEIENPTKGNYFDNNIRGVPLKYLSNELILYFSGDNTIEKFGKISSFWKTLTDNEFINSAYGHLIFSLYDSKCKKSQWEWARDSLILDKNSRQAILHFNRPIHQYIENKDFVCTMFMQFFIRNNKIYASTTMRSSDIILGWTFDIPFFMLLMQCMRNELLEYYPNIEIGSYSHHSCSLHLYKNNWEIAEEMLNHDFIEKSLPIIIENPILNKNIINLSNNIKYDENDNFIKWLDKNKGD